MSSDEQSSAHQPSGDRYELERLLGQGGAGAVYLVRDRETGERLALKRLLRTDTTSLLRLKREFRALAGIHHPNLIKLYELGHDATSAYFTMEYLEGRELMAFVQDIQSGEPGREQSELAHVLGTFHQIARGVHALHLRGRLHRDLKPSNVMVTNDRVVVLDFGLALEVGRNATTITQDEVASGTPAYMAPEQMKGEAVGEGNDWYSFGVMLYEALSGCLPIEGSLLELMQRKQSQDPCPLDDLVANLPRDLSALCMALLSRNVRERPSGELILQVLEPYAVDEVRSATRALSIAAMPLALDNELDLAVFGREVELERLRQAFRNAEGGKFVVAHVVGESGAGKSALMEQLAHELEHPVPGEDGSQALVLRSRCFERENVPFKALDGMMDAIVDHLLRESDVVVGHVLPTELRGLTQLFPALQRLPGVVQLLESAEPLGAAPQARAQAFVALRELLERLAARRPIMLWIDDLQWGDLDSAGILTDWLDASVRMPHVLLVLSYRSDEISTSRCLSQVLQRGGAELIIPVAPLGDEHIRGLCRQRLERAGAAERGKPEVIERIVHEARGSPFLASQLTALVAQRPSWAASDLASLSLHELVVQRSSMLSQPARRVLNVVSVAARPIALSLAVRAAGLEREVRAVVHELQSASMIRTRDVADERLLEVYHDRLREAVRGALTEDERVALDQRLLEALQATGAGDPDWLHGLALGAGKLGDALRFGLEAAERATDVLAFERAAALYERCIELSAETGRDGSPLWEKLAVAHAHAGRGSKAAMTYLQAAGHASSQHAFHLKRLAASHFLRSGHFEEGEQLLAEVLAAFRLEAPRSQLGLFAAIGWQRARLQMRGLDFTPRLRSELPFELLYGGELCGMLAIELAAFDPLRAAYYQARSLRITLDAGEPEYIARALCIAATMAAVSGSERGGQRAVELLDRASSIAAGLESALAESNICSARTICAFLSGHFEQTVELSYEADRLYRTITIEGEYHHRFTILTARLGALLQVGEYQRARIEFQNVAKEAEATENVSALLHLSMFTAREDILADRADVAAERLERQQLQLPRHGYGLLHFFHMLAVMRTGCATGDYDWALHLTEHSWRAYRRSVMGMSPVYALMAHGTRSRLLLHRCVRDQKAHEAARIVAPEIRVMRGIEAPGVSGTVARIRARLALLQGRRDEAIANLRESIECFDVVQRDEAAPDRLALGVLLGGDERRALHAAGLAHLREMGAVNPMRELLSYYPELADAVRTVPPPAVP